MSKANVQSIEAISEFYQQIQQFRRGLQKEMEALEIETRRGTKWITQDIVEYWRGQKQVVQRELTEFSLQLSRCLSHVREDEKRPCTEEKKRVARAKERLELCESKLRAAQAAANHWEKHLNKLRARLEQSRDLVESDLLVSSNRLQNHLETLSAYANLAHRPTGAPSNSPLAATTEDNVESEPKDNPDNGTAPDS
jgi:hypothetical protein